MNFDLTEDQRAIQRTARELLAARYKPEEVRRLALEEPRGFTDEQWREMAELGWPGLAVRESAGGAGLGMVELAVVAEELGWSLAPTPLQATWQAALVLEAAGEDELLARVASGEARGTVALYEADGAWVVPYADSAEVIVAGDAVTGSWSGEVGDPLPGLDPTRRLYAVAPGDLRPLAADAAAALDRRLVLLAAETVGVAQRAMELAVAYAKERRQFGQPIGVHQAVSHRCAQMLLEVEGARSLVYNAAWALDHDPQQAPIAAAMAKAWASDAGPRVVSSSIQVHGGIGFTWEHELHFFLKRAQANAAALGGAREQRARVASLVLDG